MGKTGNVDTGKQNHFSFTGTATCRVNDPDGSYVAADTLNENGGKKLRDRQDSVLRALAANKRVLGITAKELGVIMSQAGIERYTWPQKRLKELDKMGFVKRFNKKHNPKLYDTLEYHCFITDLGERYLKRSVEAGGVQ